MAGQTSECWIRELSVRRNDARYLRIEPRDEERLSPLEFRTQEEALIELTYIKGFDNEVV